MVANCFKTVSLVGIKPKDDINDNYIDSGAISRRS